MRVLETNLWLCHASDPFSVLFTAAISFFSIPGMSGGEALPGKTLTGPKEVKALQANPSFGQIRILWQTKTSKVMINKSINQSNFEPNHLHAAVPGLHFTTKWWENFDHKTEVILTLVLKRHRTNKH